MDENMLDELLNLDGIDSIRKSFDHYEYSGIPVPRVSHILSFCSDQDGLIKWASKMGNKYTEIKLRALRIGTMVHEMIEANLKNEPIPDPSLKLPPDHLEAVNNSYNNFIVWRNQLPFPIEEIIAIEKTIVCPWYGGTLDCIMKINGMNWLVDFKTSNSISFNYLIQLASYLWMIDNGYAPDLPYIDGIGIIRVDKKIKSPRDYFLCRSVYQDSMYINNYTQTFLSYLNAFWHSKSSDYIFRKYKEEYDLIKVLNGELIV